jgi:hypothetical protein
MNRAIAAKSKKKITENQKFYNRNEKVPLWWRFESILLIITLFTGFTPTAYDVGSSSSSTV